MDGRATVGGGTRRAGRLLRLAAAVLALSAPVSLQAQDGVPGRDAVEQVILPFVRERFYEAVDDETVTRELIAYIEGRFDSDPSAYPPVVKGYYASLEGLRGRHDSNLLRKYRFVTAAIAMMDPLVDAYPGLLELRFLRFSFYEQIPSLFGVHHRVPEDLRAIIGMLTSGRGTEVPRSVRADMIEYILGTDEPTPEQRRVLEEALRGL